MAIVASASPAILTPGRLRLTCCLRLSSALFGHLKVGLVVGPKTIDIVERPTDFAERPTDFVERPTDFGERLIA